MFVPAIVFHFRTLPAALLHCASHLVNSSNCLHNLSTKEENEDSYSYILRQCVETADLRSGKAIHAKVMKRPFLSSPFLNNHLLNMYVKCGDLQHGLRLFDKMPQKNVVSWTALIAGFVQMGFSLEALSLFCRMYRSGVKPNEFTFVSVLHACSFEDGLDCLHPIYALVLRFGFGSNVFLVNAFLTALIRHCKIDEAFEVFEKSLNKDIVTWNAMMAGYMEFSSSDVPGFWCKMSRAGVIPDNFTFASVLTGLAELCHLDMGVQVHARLIKSGHGNEMCVGNALLDMYLKNRMLVDGFKAYEEIPSKDVHTWTQMAAGCLDCGQPGMALEIIGDMRKMGVKPNKFTLSTALNSCANLASLEEGQKVHGLRIKISNDVDVCVDNALLDMYVKCGCMYAALVAFGLMTERSVISWTTMIMGYAQNGCAKEALQIFEEMKVEGVEPNYITFICVLYACSQGGFIDEGWSYFSSMFEKHGLSPGEDHYACMVNLLGRTGHLKEAENLILGMPFKPGVLLWQTLLGASQLHGDLETAKRAAKHALDIDKKDPSTYILLRNTFAGLSNWDNVGMLRYLMKSRDVEKRPGSSWIESKLSRTHEF